MGMLHEEIKFMKIWVDPKNCRGCLRCELACSYHNGKQESFNPSLSSTKVIRSNVNKRIHLAIDSSCDYCPDEDVPLCVKACVFGARGFIKRERVK